MEKCYRTGIDVCSTTVKVVIVDENDKSLFQKYERHFADIQGTLAKIFKEAKDEIGEDMSLRPVITGSGGLSLAEAIAIPFIQEVVAVSKAIKIYAPEPDVAIELGGEDAKIIYFEGKNIEQRMNGICAGGTGSFIDQMASLLQTDAGGLNEYAKEYKEIYPIAARCGVFAKSDIQPLINDGATKEDLAASIFQAVVNQTISGLACGKPIRGHVLYLGGPLHYLSELQKAFDRTLVSCTGKTPDDSHLFAAMGCAYSDEGKKVFSIDELIKGFEAGVKVKAETGRMEALFKDENDYVAFKERQDHYKVKKGDIKDHHGRVYLGIDAGSTTTKLAIIDDAGRLLWSFYASNDGDPLKVTKKAMKELRSVMPDDTKIVYSCVTGYGEALLKSAYLVDEDEVETVAHFYAAAFFDPDVDCILDIGGQDMKYIRIKDKVVDKVILNEACSSGCGSFIENFANSLGYSASEFADLAVKAKEPIDLGSRCTVFMNSRVKQAQKEGASVEDISAGLAFSVIKNALYKVIKIADKKEMGEHIVTQGGTFYNDAVLRAFEKILDTEVIRPDIAGIMGAFGAALIAKERYELDKESTLMSFDDIEAFDYYTTIAICHRCTNRCRLTINHFEGDKRNYITGNRCEKGLGKPKKESEIPNLFTYKNHIIFDRESLAIEDAPRGEVGIPRVLNMYENYPFWHTFFTTLGYRVILSPPSSRAIYELGIESIPSESECYPAKLAHGHVMWLYRQGIKFIFYPCVPYERKEFTNAQNHYNCPIVTSYAENIRNNMEELKDITFLDPFLSLEDPRVIYEGLATSFKDIPKKELIEAIDKAWIALFKAREAIKSEGHRVLAWMRERKMEGIVLAGRPYHIDPEINHGIPELITSYGLVVLSEDSISDLAEVDGNLKAVDQWMYHSRLYRAAAYVAKSDDLDLIQLNSFGCGLDAVTTDQVNDILADKNKIYTCLKIDEVNNLGAAKIRIRSLLAARRTKKTCESEDSSDTSFLKEERVIFTKKMREEYTILCPEMSPIHFDLIEVACRMSGYHLKVVGDGDEKEAVEFGLRYVNNDACYPSIIVVGQIMQALEKGDLDLDKTAVVITQTGGGCRASNYIGFIRRALYKAGLSKIPVISVNMSKLESNPGFKISLDLLIRAIYAVILGDLFMRVTLRMRPYEKVKGTTDALYEKYDAIAKEFLSKKKPKIKDFKELCAKIVKDFDAIEITDEVKPKVGIVGEILVKFSPAANNHIVKLLEKEGAEAVVPDLLDFLYYCFYNTNFKAEHLGAKATIAHFANMGMKLIDKFRAYVKKPLADSKHFDAPSDIKDLAFMAKDIVSLGNQTGEGWLLTGVMLELIHSGTTNIVCTQPFGCLPNHIVGKGVMKKLREEYPDANLVAIDYDSGASEVNQLNRIKLMLSVAKENLKS